MDRDTKSLISDEYTPNQDNAGDTWVAVEVKNRGNDFKNQNFNQTTSSAASHNSTSRSIPTMQSTSGNQMGYDLTTGSPPIQDMQLVERLAAFQGETPAHFQQGRDTPTLSPGASTTSPASRPSTRAPSPDPISPGRENLTVPVYQGGFGSLRPGFATGRNDLTFSVTANYYGDADPRMRSIRAAATAAKKSQVRQKKRMPAWMRYIILKLVGAKTIDNDNVIVGNIFYFLTLVSGLLYVTTHTLFLGYNATSSKTTLTTIEASLQTLNCLFGTSLGVYANRLAAKLFGYQKLLDSIRMHTKSVLKIPASAWALILILAFIGSDFYDRYMEIIVEPVARPTPLPTPSNETIWEMKKDDEQGPGYVTSCANLGLSPILCIIDVYARLAFSSVAGLWNLLVLMVILSICRTHTVGIRRFIKELEADGRVIENHYRSQVMDVNVDMFSIMMNEVDNLDPDSDDEYESSWPQAQQHMPQTQHTHINNEVPIIRREIHEGGRPDVTASGPSDIRSQAPARPSVDTACSEESRGGVILSVNDILLRYWSINSRLAFTGLVVQRWVTCWIIFVVSWVAQMIVYWIKNDTRIQEIFLVAIPLILLPLVCSALSEVNFEGDRVCRRICPTSERLDLLFFVTRNPLHLTIYGQTVRFGNMSNGLIGLATALFTGIAINKFMKNVH